MKIKFILGLSILFIAATLFMSVSCLSESKSKKSNNKSEGKINPEVQIKTETKEASSANRSYPPNWPWRGVSIPSIYSGPKDIEYLHSVGVNCLRLQPKSPLRAKREKTSPVKAFYDELDWIDMILDECKKYGMTTIIAFNYVVIDPKDKNNDKSEEFWTSKTYQDSTFRMVDIIAKRFKDRGDELAAYEVIGEPAISSTLEKAKTPNNLEIFDKQVLATIRKYDNKRYLYLCPGPWGTPENYKGFNGFNIKDEKLIYGAHMYLPHDYTHQGIKGNPKGIPYPGHFKTVYWDKKKLIDSFKHLKEFETKTGNLIYIGEFQAVRWAQGCNIWVKDVTDIIDSNGWGWCYYAYKPDYDFWNPFFEVANPQDDPKSWTLKNTGPEAEIWKYMVNTYFSKNK